MRVTPRQIVGMWHDTVIGHLQANAIGHNAHIANGLTAMFIACGQDAACIVEASTALTRIESRPCGDVYASVTLPNLIVGTVGGGTYLPTATECLALLGCAGNGKAAKLAEICAVVALAGELAIVGAMAGGTFAQAHAAGGRKGLSAAPEGTA